MSEEVKHTPGPWVLDPQYLSEVQTEGMKTIASCWHEQADGATITVTGVLPCSLEESAANARLIAAAPELLGALRFILAFYEPRQNYLDTNAWTQAEASARRAVAKAEGRSA